MNREIFKIPIFTLCAGIISRIVQYISTFLLASGTSEWTYILNIKAFYIDLITSIILFIGVGLLLRRNYNRANFIKSATLLCVYSIVLLILEQIMHYNWIISYLYLPVELFTILTSIVVRMSTSQSINWLYAIPSCFAPYLLIFFSKKVVCESYSK